MKSRPSVLSVFTGAGGLDLGLEAAGFRTLLCVENDPDALATIAANRPGWLIAKDSDAIQFSNNAIGNLRAAKINPAQIDLLAGGPPCQPYSKASFWTAHGPRRMRDPRASTTIRAYLRIVDQVLPKILLFENVPAFAFRKRNEGLATLLRGLRRINRLQGVEYKPQLIKINAADYGIPQMRERVFIVAHIEGRTMNMPPPTHGPKSLTGKEYLTAWDALGSRKMKSPDLCPQGRWASLLPSIPEGKNYLWHTPGQGGQPLFGWRTKFWSFLLKLAKNQPAWTIPASPGPAVGPFHWDNRLLSSEELSRLQTFPKKYKIVGSRRACQRQLGNAVPAALAELIGQEIRRQLLRNLSVPSRVSLLPRKRGNRPAARKVRSVPKQYLSMRAKHKPHPGTGKGPGRVK
jgi:DNA (cytosine-5)-methyltransferase 1